MMRHAEVLHMVTKSIADDSQVIINFNQTMSKGIACITIESDIVAGLTAKIIATGTHWDGEPITPEKACEYIYMHSSAITEII
ncbi:hypothetical protein FDJ47_gp48 [Enterobacter phage Ec_L1]|uniref:Uncharacterized protein n=1 Tax=Enterobacter phage Ec_L1 TaxID=2070180 RepID=A0A2P0W9X1_9CAUD|nr:hypothetical protein FDJ47_gp48 [Enterobacter phage Ec_L1]AUV57162.1 hypothetical protein Ec48 [Enterobacter phage Ec_L1]